MSGDDPEEVLAVEDSVDDEDVADLRNLARRSSNPTTRMEAVNVLGEVGRDVRESTRREIVDDLTTVVLQDGNDDVRATAIDALYFLDSGNVDDLVGAIADRCENGDSGTDPGEYFRAWLTSSVSEFRIVGAAAMERFGDGSVVPELTDAFADSDPRVRARAVRAYGRLGEQVNARPIRTLLDDNRSLVRQAAARTLGNIGGETAFEVLVSAAQAEDSRLRLAAVEQLSGFDHPKSVVTLIRSLVDNSSAVRHRGAVSLIDLLSTSRRIDVGDVPDRIESGTDAAEIRTLADTLFEVATGANDEAVQHRIYAAWLLGELSQTETDSDLPQHLVELLQSGEDRVVDLAAAYLKRLEGEEIERELQMLISNSSLTPETREKTKTILRRVKRNGAATIVDQSIEYTYVQAPRDYTAKHDE